MLRAARRPPAPRRRRGRAPTAATRPVTPSATPSRTCSTRSSPRGLTPGRGRGCLPERPQAATPPYTGLSVRDLETLRCAYRDGTEPYVIHQFVRQTVARAHASLGLLAAALAPAVRRRPRDPRPRVRGAAPPSPRRRPVIGARRAQRPRPLALVRERGGPAHAGKDGGRELAPGGLLLRHRPDFFPGAVALLNSLRLTGHDGPSSSSIAAWTRQRAVLEPHATVVDAPPDAPPSLQKLAPRAHPARFWDPRHRPVVTRPLEPTDRGAAGGRSPASKRQGAGSRSGASCSASARSTPGPTSRRARSSWRRPPRGSSTRRGAPGAHRPRADLGRRRPRPTPSTTWIRTS